MKLKWDGENYVMGGWIVGWAGYTSLRSREEPPYKAQCFLPGIERKVFKLQTSQENARRIVEEYVDFWLRKAGIQC